MGLNYRKAALKELKTKGDFDPTVISQKDVFRSRTSLLQLKSDVKDYGVEIYDQYGKAESFQLWTKNGNLTKGNWYSIPDSSLQLLSKLYPDASYILVDTSLSIRNIYYGDPIDVIKDVVSHVAIVLPRKKEKDIKMKKR